MTPRVDRWGDELDDDDDVELGPDWTPSVVPAGPLLPPTPEQLAALREVARAGRSAYVDADVAPTTETSDDSESSR